MDINPDLEISVADKPLAGTCLHDWHDLKSPYHIAQICIHCRLFRYKPAPVSDWEFRAPIPRTHIVEE